jgi:hypothetical protein
VEMGSSQKPRFVSCPQRHNAECGRQGILVNKNVLFLPAFDSGEQRKTFISPPPTRQRTSHELKHASLYCKRISENG